MHQTFTEESLVTICNKLAKKETAFKNILDEYGYPPFWARKASFETLIHIILEQQVSLASARAALQKLKEQIGTVTPKKLIQLSDAALKACYFSRQKIVYARCLAEAFVKRKIVLQKLAELPDEEIRSSMLQVKGIGNWTVDVFLMMVLHRPNLFPTGDIALMNSVKHVMKLPASTSKEHILELAKSWQPYRTIAAFMFWHAYIKRKKIVY